MIERYRVVARRIPLELAELETTVNRAERAMIAAQGDVENQDLFLDSVALNLHDFYRTHLGSFLRKALRRVCPFFV